MKHLSSKGSAPSFLSDLFASWSCGRLPVPPAPRRSKVRVDDPRPVAPTTGALWIWPLADCLHLHFHGAWVAWICLVEPDVVATCTCSVLPGSSPLCRCRNCCKLRNGIQLGWDGYGGNWTLEVDGWWMMMIEYFAGLQAKNRGSSRVYRKHMKNHETKVKNTNLKFFWIQKNLKTNWNRMIFAHNFTLMVPQATTSSGLWPLLRPVSSDGRLIRNSEVFFFSNFLGLLYQSFLV